MHCVTYSKAGIHLIHAQPTWPTRGICRFTAQYGLMMTHAWWSCATVMVRYLLSVMFRFILVMFRMILRETDTGRWDKILALGSCRLLWDIGACWQLTLCPWCNNDAGDFKLETSGDDFLSFHHSISDAVQLQQYLRFQRPSDRAFQYHCKRPPEKRGFHLRKSKKNRKSTQRHFVVWDFHI